MIEIDGHLFDPVAHGVDFDFARAWSEVIKAEKSQSQEAFDEAFQMIMALCTEKGLDFFYQHDRLINGLLNKVFRRSKQKSLEPA